MGTDNPNVVLGIDTTGSRNIGRDIPLNPNSTPIENQVGATYHVGVGGGPTNPTQTLQGQKQGYAAGMVESKVPTGTTFVNAVASTSPGDMTVNFDPDSNTLNASITVRDVQNHDDATDAYTLGFGDNPSNPNGRSAYIDDRNYAAIENGTSEVSYYDYSNSDQHPPLSNYEYSEATSYFVNGDQLGVTAYFPETFEPTAEGAAPPFCTKCEFIAWGAWGSRVAFGNEGNPANPEYVDDVHMGWWVAGNVVKDTVGALPLSGDANYAGHAIGNVASLGSSGWNTYVATGNMDMKWNFGTRSGTLDIRRFDTSVTPNGLSFGGTMNMPGVVAPGQIEVTNLPNQFSGGLTGSSPIGSLTGSANGSFVSSPGPGQVPSGVLGNFNVSNSVPSLNTAPPVPATYVATGIFAGSPAASP
jgi:hypothetical protein